MRIRVVVPTASEDFAATLFKELSAAARPDTELTLASLDRGPASIESRYDEALAAPNTVTQIVRAERDGAHAVVTP